MKSLSFENGIHTKFKTIFGNNFVKTANAVKKKLKIKIQLFLPKIGIRDNSTVVCIQESKQTYRHFF